MQATIFRAQSKAQADKEEELTEEKKENKGP